MKTVVRTEHNVLITKPWGRRGLVSDCWTRAWTAWHLPPFTWRFLWCFPLSCSFTLKCVPPCYQPFLWTQINWPSMTFLRSSLSTLVQSRSPSQGSLWIRQPGSLLFGTQLSCPRCKEIVHDIFCSALNVRLWDQGKCQDWWTMGTWSYFLTRATDHPSVG